MEKYEQLKFTTQAGHQQPMQQSSLRNQHQTPTFAPRQEEPRDQTSMFVRDLRERQHIADDNQNIAPNMNMYAASQMEKQEWLRDTNGL